MPHKLLFSWDLLGYLARDDALDVELTVKNIGEAPFSGKFTSITFAFPQVTMSVFSNELPNISNLQPNVPLTLPKIKMYAMNHGLSWIRARVQADDGQPVEHYQNEPGHLSEEGPCHSMFQDREKA